MAPSKVTEIDFTTFYNIVDGKQRSGKNVTQGVNPATKEKLWDLPIATEQDVNDAVDAAKKAFKKFSQTPVEERKKLLNKFIDVYMAYEQEFTDLMCKETGKPRTFAANEVQGCKLMLSHHAGLDLPTEKYEDDEKSIVTNYVPLGVVGAICPWNFPLALAVGKLAPAILSGKI
jgi:acyl-CoA reductase-like NAD-dependent aldehyde dehydrogenase